MAELSQQDILLTGKIIAASREIESRMAACGATGNGLREKTESLAGKPPPEAVKLSIYVGNIRNRLAHESAGKVSEEEYALFEAASQTLLSELDKLAAGGKPAPAPAASPAEPVPEGSTAVPDGAAEPPAPAVPEVYRFRLWAWFPGAHILFALELLWHSLRGGWEYWALSAIELASLAGVWAAIFRWKLNWLLGVMLSLFALVWLIGIWDKLRRRDETRLGGAAWWPLVNLAYFVGCIGESFRPALFTAAAAMAVGWGGAIYFAVIGEWRGLLFCAVLSWLCGLAGGWFVG